ncbi:phenylalanine--tRNA ligase subunit beta [Catenuloplanes atrovinosus]|uniref:Phenylalanine--tRNA ligase beta subunit n=1 Tax=Catenuloplanes atrovinosus TaxID=137266 RepID=A0AAE3YRS9_9ACTN|nr:phenylalanine--tRNA ligase subunit beta [Catenuloplanes atrovinosus]MDR7277471.1 phenylalanyl-tRNA synthetase beta chain [Catenuloplanes atrovinosus]
MRIGVSWLREHVDLPVDLTGTDVEQALVSLGIEVDSVVDQAATVTGSLVVGRVLTIEELTGFKKPIRFCTVDVGNEAPQEIVCGARNFAAGDLVVVILPGGELPGGFRIGARKTYGRMSAGMICSAAELGLSDDHDGIIVLSGDHVPGTDARPLVGLDDIILELEITPDRGYAMSVRGLARELSHALKVPFRDPALAAAPAGTEDVPWPVTVEDRIGCDRFSARLVRGVDPSAPSPDFIKRRLAVAGVRSIGLAVDITNYVMLEFGQPMHAFDADLLDGPLLVRRALPGEKITTLDGVVRSLDTEDMVICSGEAPGVPISLAAVMGGETSEVQPTTTNVLFEAAHWDAVMVGRTARRHKLFSEAAKRWERGVDPALTLVALERAVSLLLEHGGPDASAAAEILDLDYRRPAGFIELDATLPARRIGVDYSRDQVIDLLQRVGCAVAASTSSDVLTVTPPSWRPDLTDPADLVEEVVRLDGYDVVPSVLPTAPPGNGLTAAQARRRSVARALAENGYVEVLNYPFMSAAVFDAFGMPSSDNRRSAVRLANPLSEEEPLLRSTLLPPLLTTLRRNIGRGTRDLALYEIGAVFHPRPGAGSPPAMGVDERPSDDDLFAADATLPKQPWHVAVVLAGETSPSGWWGEGRQATWADAVEAARTVLSAAGIPAGEITVSAGDEAPWHPGRCAAISVDGTIVGFAGELHPAAISALELPRRTCAMELNLTALPPAPVVQARPLSTYPPALIDVALVVPADVPAGAVEATLAGAAGPLLEAVRLFDVYESDSLGEGRKSLAFKLTFRAPDRTLTVEEAVSARDAAVAAAASQFGATLRGA